MTSPNSFRKYLYFDSSDFLVLGILNEKFEWLEYLEFPDKKSASQIHPLLNNLTKKHEIDPLGFEGVFICSGPGSYTGIRLSENFAQIFEWQNKKVYSFFHHEAPYLLGVKKGTWICPAFKGETFVYNWSEAENGSDLIATNLLEVEQKQIYQHAGTHSTRQMIKEKSQSFFSLLKDRNIRLAPYYFRSLDNEFKAQGT
jgi:tRNA A37 threonylcarbamoyladenosine modification protein TsaB